MKVLVFGPSGSGKTYISNALRQTGIAAFDADDIEGLSAWYDKHGRQVPPPTNAAEAINNQYSFIWNRQFLTTFLEKYTDVFIFGGSGNVFDLFDLFDKVYFLQIPSALQKERLLQATDRNRQLDFNENEMVLWGQWLEEEARKKHIPMLDGTLTPAEIYNIISTPTT